MIIWISIKYEFAIYELYIQFHETRKLKIETHSR